MLTALNRILPDNHKFANNIVKSMLNLDSLSTCNALLGLSGYKTFGRTKYESYLRDIDSAPIPFSQLLTNIEILIKEVKTRGTGVKASYCLSWVKYSAAINNENNHEMNEERSVKVVSKVLRGEFGKKISFHVDTKGGTVTGSSRLTAHLQAMPINGTICPDFPMPNVISMYKGLPHLCLSRRKRNTSTNFNADRSFELFQDHFLSKYVDGSIRSKTNGFAPKNLVTRMEIKTFPVGDRTSPPNPFVFVANEAISSEMRDKLIHVASSETWIKGVRGGKETFFRATTTEPTHPSLVPHFHELGEYRARGKKHVSIHANWSTKNRTVVQVL
jgi:hypothetical protein